MDAIKAYEADWFTGFSKKKFALVAILEGGLCFSEPNRRNLPWLRDYRVIESPPIQGAGTGGRGMYMLVHSDVMKEHGVGVAEMTIDKSFLHVALARAGCAPTHIFASHLPCKVQPKALTTARSTASLVRELLHERRPGTIVLDIGDQNSNLLRTEYPSTVRFFF